MLILHVCCMFPRGQPFKVPLLSSGPMSWGPDLPQIEIDEMLRLMRDVGSEVATHHTVPGGVVLLVELLCGSFVGIFFGDAKSYTPGIQGQ